MDSLQGHGQGEMEPLVHRGAAVQERVDLTGRLDPTRYYIMSLFVLLTTNQVNQGALSVTEAL